MNQEQLINLQGQTIVDFTKIIIAGGNPQALTDWRKRLLNCINEIERMAKRDEAKEGEKEEGNK